MPRIEQVLNPKVLSHYDSCTKCLKVKPLCVCDQINPQKNKIEILILQHPQEPDKVLGSAKICQLGLEKATLKVGLSWPNLTKALGREVDPTKWAVLYLGGKEILEKHKEKTILLTNKKEEVFNLKTTPLEGIIVLDGTWSQAKTLWWRNAWLLKLKRVVLNLKQDSLYGKLRREPRRECLSTLESVAEVLVGLGENPAIKDSLFASFLGLLEKVKGLVKEIESGRPSDIPKTNT